MGCGCGSPEMKVIGALILQVSSSIFGTLEILGMNSKTFSDQFGVPKLKKKPREVFQSITGPNTGGLGCEEFATAADPSFQ